jgi:hypothetical protein
MKEQLHYFAYGSNMSLQRLRARVPAAQPLGSGILYGHELRFHKRGRDGSGKCDAFQVDKRNARVIGALFSLPQDGKAELDRIEGLGGGYEQKMVSVARPDGSYSRAMTYYATDIGETLVPYCWYRQHVLAGAREFALPDDYIEAIASVPINRDTNQARWEKELSLYT